LKVLLLTLAAFSLFCNLNAVDQVVAAAVVAATAERGAVPRLEAAEDSFASVLRPFQLLHQAMRRSPLWLLHV